MEEIKNLLKKFLRVLLVTIETLLVVIYIILEEVYIQLTNIYKNVKIRVSKMKELFKEFKKDKRGFISKIILEIKAK